MGSVIFPDAKTKVFLTASVEIRAERRYKQLIAKGLRLQSRRFCRICANATNAIANVAWRRSGRRPMPNCLKPLP